MGPATPAPAHPRHRDGLGLLTLGQGSKESLAGRFERITLSHWAPATLAKVFKVGQGEAAELSVLLGTYPGAFQLRGDPGRFGAYVRDAIVEPAITKDILSLVAVRLPALLRQVFARHRHRRRFCRCRRSRAGSGTVVRSKP